MNNQFNPLNESQLSNLTKLSENLNREQLLWLNGYFQGLLVSDSSQKIQNNSVISHSNKELKILYGTHTGKSKSIAEKLAGTLSDRGVETRIISLDDYKPRQLTSEANLVVIVSTHGEGEPPAMAEDFYTFITGKRAPQLPNLNYSVVALGDKSYKLYCQTGIDIDRALANSGAKPILPILTLDVDFEEDLERWISEFLHRFTETTFNSESLVIQNNFRKHETYTRRNPFHATVTNKIKITGRGSDKEVYHVELSLEGSGISYEPGDSLGILANNPPELVENILKFTGLDGNEQVTLRNDFFTLREALSEHLEITVINRDVIKKYLEKTGNQKLKNIFQNEQLLEPYLVGHDVLDLLEDFSYAFSAMDLVDILRSFPARLYSISSSQAAVGDEVHITVAAVRYSNKGRSRAGACSTYLADRIAIDSQIAVFIEKNPAFKLPEKADTPVILIGAGTGVAPYRSFLQHREANNQKGKTWLFFGERRFHSDFLYQIEWQKFLKEGYLEKIDVAFSRDQEEKIYVQNRLVEKQAEVFSWLKHGASIYLCGDMKQMARDVQDTLLRIFETQGGMTEDKALEYMKKLKKEKRFQTDVY